MKNSGRLGLWGSSWPFVSSKACRASILGSVARSDWERGVSVGVIGFSSRAGDSPAMGVFEVC